MGLNQTLGSYDRILYTTLHPQPTGEVETNPLVLCYKWRITTNSKRYQQIILLWTTKD